MCIRNGAQSIAAMFKGGDGIQHEFDFSQFWNKCVHTFALTAGEHITNLQNESFFKSIVSYISDKRKAHPEDFEAFTLSAQICRSLTLQQMEMLSALDSWFMTDDNFIGSYFQKQNSELLSTENQEIWSNEQKLENLLKLYKLSESQKHPVDFQLEFLKDILTLGPKINEYNEPLFRELINKVDKQSHPDLFKQDKKKAEVVIQ